MTAQPRSGSSHVRGRQHAGARPRRRGRGGHARAGLGAGRPGQRRGQKAAHRGAARQGQLLRPVWATAARAASTTARTDTLRGGAWVPPGTPRGTRPPAPRTGAAGVFRSLRGNGRRARARAATGPPDGPAPGRAGTTRVSESHGVGPQAGRAAKSALEKGNERLPSAGRGAETPPRRPRLPARKRAPRRGLRRKPSLWPTHPGAPRRQRPIGRQMRARAWKAARDWRGSGTAAARGDRRAGGAAASGRKGWGPRMGGPCARGRARARARGLASGRSHTRGGRPRCRHPPHDGHHHHQHRDPVGAAAGTSGGPRVSVGSVSTHCPERVAAGRKSTFQPFGKEVSLVDQSMCPVPSTVHREPICCECQAKFGGCLPVPRVKAALPYWVPLSLRPRKQIQKMVRFHIPKTSEACPCPCHRFGGRLPMPRDQAVMPYWVPQVLRPHKKVVKKQQSCKGIQEPALDLRSWYNRWRICCDGRLLLKWQQLQALHQHEPLAPGRGVSPPAPLLPFSLLTLLQAVLRVVVAIRHLFWF
ncbi:uncharacterized protein C16orf95 homolog isoform X2 [Mirounga angustirostris]|uniref:uncharacterized protein C16orf95 homolog isoform X2 n=1 Tax=Mirounga angustirostris TaxID=9716 RepID=UPI00313D609A